MRVGEQLRQILQGRVNDIGVTAVLTKTLWDVLNELDKYEMKEDDYLIERVAFLECLEQCGVDNWEGYSAALELYNE